MPPLDPSADFADDGGTPQWRARHAPQTIDVYPNRRAAFRDLMRKQPLIGLWLGVILSIGLYLFFGVEIAGFLIYGLICRLLGNG
jgi:hypothetical protein